jgi:hypothetical protein
MQMKNDMEQETKKIEIGDRITNGKTIIQVHRIMLSDYSASVKQILMFWGRKCHKNGKIFKSEQEGMMNEYEAKKIVKS